MKQRVYTKDIILVLAASFFYMSSPMLVTPLITGFSSDLGTDAALMGMIGGIMYLCSLLCRPIAGNLADKLSKYKLAFVGAGLMLLACVGYIAAPNPAVVVAARIVNGIGFACCSVCMSTWVSNMLPRDKIGSGMGVYGAINALGMAVAPAIGVSIYQAIGYRPAFAVAASFSLLTVVIIQFVKDKGEPEPSIRTEEKRRLQVIDKNVLPVALIVMLFTIPYCATQSCLVSYAEVRGLSVNISFFFPAYAAVLLILRFSLKNLFDKLPFVVFLLGSSICAAGAIISLSVMQSNAGMFIAAAFMAGGYGIMCSVCQSTAILLAGEGRRGLANSTYYVGLDLGLTFGPTLGGVLFEYLDAEYFFPVFLATIPAGLAVYALGRKKFKYEV